MDCNKAKSLWIMTRSCWVMLYYSMKILVLALIGKGSRKNVDALISQWSNRLLNIIKVTYTIKNPNNVSLQPEQHYIIMSNHISHYDIPLIFKALPNASIRMLTKKELFRVPIWGQAMKKAEFISVDRQNHQQAIKDLEYAKEKMQSGVIIWIAPEGTRSRTGELQAFKKGGFVLAIETKAKIIPIAISGTYEILPPKTSNFRLGQQVTMQIGEAIDAANYSLDQREELIETVRNSIQAMLTQNPTVH